MRVFYESLQSDFTELCDQYVTVISSILDWETCTWDVREKIPYAYLDYWAVAIESLEHRCIEIL